MSQVIAPHDGQRAIRRGASAEHATAGMILLHGRGATAENIILLAEQFDRPDFAYVAPQAASNTWYPYSFMSNIENNEPGISSGFSVIKSALLEFQQAGLPAEKVFLLGFSQGACLVLEYAARHAQRYGGIIGLSGGLIGPDGTLRNYPGSLLGTPVFLGCSDVDPHIPEHRVEEASRVLRKLGGQVTRRLYHNMGHTVNDDEIDFVQEMMSSLP